MDKPQKHFLDSERQLIHLLLTGKVNPNDLSADFPPVIFEAHHVLLVASIYDEWNTNKSTLTRNRYRQYLADAKAGGDLMQNMTVYDKCLIGVYAKPEQIGELKIAVMEGYASRHLYNVTEAIRTVKQDGARKALERVQGEVTKALGAIGNGDGFEVVTASLVERKPMQWLWDHRVELGALTLFSGDPGIGKSFVSLYVAARLSRGEPMPSSHDHPPVGETLIFSVEDSPSIIADRLDWQVADLSKIHIIRGTTSGRMIALDRDMRLLERELKRHPGVRLVVVDPLSAYLGKADSYKTADVQQVLNPLSKIAYDHNIAILGVRHVTKDAKTNPLYRGVGSVAFSGCGRMEWGFVRDREDETVTNMVQLKHSHSAAAGNMSFRINPQSMRLEWSATTITAREAFADAHAMPKARAKEWLETVLAEGAIESEKVQEMARKEGISWRTLSNAKKELGVKSTKVGGHWEMELAAGNDNLG